MADQIDERFRKLFAMMWSSVPGERAAACNALVEHCNRRGLHPNDVAELLSPAVAARFTTDKLDELLDGTGRLLALVSERDAKIVSLRMQVDALTRANAALAGQAAKAEQLAEQRRLDLERNEGDRERLNSRLVSCQIENDILVAEHAEISTTGAQLKTEIERLHECVGALARENEQLRLAAGQARNGGGSCSPALDPARLQPCLFAATKIIAAG